MDHSLHFQVEFAISHFPFCRTPCIGPIGQIGPIARKWKMRNGKWKMTNELFLLLLPTAPALLLVYLDSVLIP
jgi:hypothetical protein